MSTYAIGDIQGCFSPLQKLLDKIQFDPQKDMLWFTGDLVNRGPQSLETLRFVKQLGKNQITVLGNHDLHLLATAHGQHGGWDEDTFHDILRAPDREELLAWLLQRPILHHDAKLNYLLVHAGLAINWDLEKAINLAHELENVLRGSQVIDFFKNMYGNEPDFWDDQLQGWDRLRCITNFFTRLRFCHPDGRMELKNKGKVENAAELTPWYKVQGRKNATLNILFGHWAALGGVTNTPHTYALDTGCVWGFDLTAMRLEDQERFSVKCG